MIFGTMLMILTAASADPQFNQFGYPTVQFRDEVNVALTNGIKEYAICSRNESNKFYKGPDAAPIIAEAAMNKCSKIESQLVELNANYIAIKSSIDSGFEFKMMARNAQERRDELWKPIRDKIKSSIISYVLELRAKRK